MKTRYYVIFAVMGVIAIFPVISVVFYGAVPIGINYKYFENCEECDIVLDGLRTIDSKVLKIQTSAGIKKMMEVLLLVK